MAFNQHWTSSGLYPCQCHIRVCTGRGLLVAWRHGRALKTRSSMTSQPRCADRLLTGSLVLDSPPARRLRAMPLPFPLACSLITSDICRSGSNHSCSHCCSAITKTNSLRAACSSRPDHSARKVVMFMNITPEFMECEKPSVPAAKVTNGLGGGPGSAWNMTSASVYSTVSVSSPRAFISCWRVGMS
eukprot:2447605-Prymnesium_polylepis.1